MRSPGVAVSVVEELGMEHLPLPGNVVANLLDLVAGADAQLLQGRGVPGHLAGALLGLDGGAALLGTANGKGQLNLCSCTTGWCSVSYEVSTQHCSSML